MKVQDWKGKAVYHAMELWVIEIGTSHFISRLNNGYFNRDSNDHIPCYPVTKQSIRACNVYTQKWKEVENRFNSLGVLFDYNKLKNAIVKLWEDYMHNLSHLLNLYLYKQNGINNWMKDVEDTHTKILS